MNTRLTDTIALIVGLTLSVACATDEALDTGAQPDLAELSLELGDASADPAAAGLVPLTEAPVPSFAIDGAWIRVWINPEAADDYIAIRPDAYGSGVSLPEGTLIVREVYDADMVLTKRTLIAREGNPDELGGWLFGVYDTEGGVMVDKDGVEQIGVLADCVGCHLARPDDDYLYGLPRQ